MLADGGSRLYLGPALDAMAAAGDLLKVSSRAARVRPTSDLAAKMFAMNIRTWKRSRFVRDNVPPDTVADLEVRLRALAGTPTDARDIEWRLRQIVFERPA